MTLVLAAAAFALPARAEDAARGAALFETCRSCHSLDPQEAGMAGPNLASLGGRRVGSAAGFDYSAALRSAGEAGAIWDEARLVAFLEDPDGMFPGLWMSDPGVRRAADRAAIAAFLMRR